jgi:spoIIIJ-associated protein
MGIFNKIFGQKKVNGNSLEEVIRELLGTVIEKSGLDLSFEIETEFVAGKEGQFSKYKVNFFGPDEQELTEREGQLMDALQLFVRRALQNRYPDDNCDLVFDCNGYLEETEQALVELAEKAKNMALQKKRAFYLKALPAKDRKVVHQHLASDDRVKSRSIGDGLYKKIKIYPAFLDDQQDRDQA